MIHFLVSALFLGVLFSHVALPLADKLPITLTATPSLVQRVMAWSIMGAILLPLTLAAGFLAKKITR